MKRPRVKTYMALLLTLSMTAGAVLSVGDAQARIEGTTTLRNTVLQVRHGAVVSNWLNAAGDQTVLLGSLASGEWVSADVTLEAREPVTCPMVWYTTEGAPVGIEAAFSLLEGAGSLDEQNILNMEAGSKAIVTLTLTAADTLPEDRTVDVQMFCGDLSGAFRVELIGDLPESAEPEDSGSMDVVLPGGPGHPTQTVPDQTVIELKTLGEFETASPLPVKVTRSGQAEELRIGLEGEEPLPAMTRYSTDGGAHWYVLYEDGYIVLEDGSDGEEEAHWLLLVDLQKADLGQDTPMVLEATALALGEVTGVGEAQTIPRAGPERSDVPRILRAPKPEELQWFTMLAAAVTEPVALTEPGQLEPVVPVEEEESQPTEPVDPRELDETASEHAYFRIPLPIGWAEATQIRYQAQVLAVTEEGTIGYTPTEWDAQGLNAVVDPESGELVVYMGEHTPAAGTYRLTLECLYEGICFHQMQTTFFINYSIRSDMENEEVPDNE